ncbi:Minor histocompatibility antigen H13 [Phytophthora cinnamomi]|uniref:Minor histocompatibility antigen H13 n=1 Tax=Phytophthora cinnamomi TaxID=4785 RepID=UPI00355A4F72|nr:Minor histocompatibility antigen H13 [Phytophthora cinnamomi]KAG6614748.1 Minor histocompatibility antigen H13 [Phytophthora cinnamomi]
MTPSMVATRNALPLSTPATLMFVREKTDKTSDDTCKADVVTASGPRDSTGAKLSRKMKDLFRSNKASKQAPSPSEQRESRKEAQRRQYIASLALVRTGFR